MSSASDPGGAALRRLIGADRIGRDVYTDPALFELEMTRLFARTWLYVGHDCQIPRPGDYFTTRLGRRDVIVVRGEDGCVRVLHNRCPHRSTHVCGNPSGSVQRFICPYHSWTFDLEGRMLGMPWPHEYGPTFDKTAHALEPVARVDTYRGFIFARLAPGGPGLREFLGPVTQAFDDLLDRSPTGEIEPVPGVIRHRCRANWKMMFENLNDVYHPLFSHQSAEAGLRAVSDPEKLHRIMRSFVVVRDMVPMLAALSSNVTRHGHSFISGAISMANPEVPRDEHFAALAAVHGEARAQAILSTDMHLVLLYPSCNVNPSQQTVRVIRPVRVDETEVWGYCFRLKGVPEFVTRNSLYYCNYLTSAFSPVVVDDLEIYERAQQNLEQVPEAVNDCARGLGATGDGPAATSEAYIRHQYEVWLEHLTDAEPPPCAP